MVECVREITSVDVLLAGGAEVVTNPCANHGVGMEVNVYLPKRVNVHVDSVDIIVNKVNSTSISRTDHSTHF